MKIIAMAEVSARREIGIAVDMAILEVLNDAVVVVGRETPDEAADATELSGWFVLEGTAAVLWDGRDNFCGVYPSNHSIFSVSRKKTC
jgi:hypothetical protein